MACKDLQEFIHTLQHTGNLCCITEQVETELELADITVQVSTNHGPALMFEKPGGHDIPVLTNAFGAIERICTALGTEDIETAVARVKDMLLEYEESSINKENGKAEPETPGIDPPPCREIILEGDDVDISKLPVPRCWPLDAGPAITLPVIFTRDPETGTPNAGLYRMQVLGRHTTGMHWYPGSGGALHYEKACRRGEPLSVAVAIGPPPAVTLAACAPLPEDLYEIDFAERLSDSHIQMTPCLHSDLHVPASSQIILEGLVYPDRRMQEGPFGNHTGYYSEPAEYPVFNVTCMSMRKDAVFPSTVPGPPPQEDCFMAKALERLFLPVIRNKIPEITDINFPLEGIFNRIVFVSIEKRYPGHPADVMKSLWHLGKGMFSKIIWVFDSEVNVQDASEVMWKMANCVNPCIDIITLPNGRDPLDPAALNGMKNCRMGVDCTEKWPEERDGLPWPPKMTMTDDVREKTLAVLKKIGLEHWDGSG